MAILSTADFDATQVDPQSVGFGPNGAKEAHGDGPPRAPRCPPATEGRRNPCRLFMIDGVTAST